MPSPTFDEAFRELSDQDKTFLDASDRGHHAHMTTALSYGADAHVRNAQGRNAWHLLARRPSSPGMGPLSRSHVALVKLLLNHGVGLDLPDQDGLTPLAIAVDNGNQRLVARLLELKANPNARCEHQVPVLSRATGRDEPDVVDALLAAGADVHATDPLGWNALHHAAFGLPEGSPGRGDHTAQLCAEHLLAAGANVHGSTGAQAQGTSAETPLQMAVRRNTVGVARALLTAGALDPLGVPERQALLNQGVREGAWTTLDLLIGHGLTQGIPSSALAPLFSQVPSGSVTHRHLEGHVLGHLLDKTPSSEKSAPVRHRL